MAAYKDVIAGLQLFASKEENPKAQMGGASHDVIFGGSLYVELTEEEELNLKEWGWFKDDDEYHCWCCFV